MKSADIGWISDKHIKTKSEVYFASDFLVA